MRKLSLATLLPAIGLAACGGGIAVRGTGVSAPPRPAGCELEILQKPPARPYEVLADLETHLTLVPREGALSVVQPKACALGADALIVIQNMVLNEFGHTLVEVTAIRYRPPAPAPEPEPEPATPPPAAPPAPAPEPATPPVPAPDAPKPRPPASESTTPAR